jgi:hypothetical protein
MTLHRDSALRSMPTPSRRALLTGAAGALAGIAVSSLGRPQPVRAIDGEPVLVGGEYTSTSVTKITNSANADDVIAGVSTSGVGVHGTSSSSTAVWGNSTSGNGIFGQSSTSRGVWGTSSSYIGVQGSSVSNIGVFGTSSAAAHPASLGLSQGNSTGVFGVSGPGVPATKARTGVYGYAAQSGRSKGVWGHSPTGHGVHGSSGTGFAGYFAGKVFTTKFYEMKESGTPTAPGTNKARLFIRDNGSGKTQLCVRFHTGAVRVLAVQP